VPGKRSRPGGIQNYFAGLAARGEAGAARFVNHERKQRNAKEFNEAEEKVEDAPGSAQAFQDYRYGKNQTDAFG